MDWSNEDYVRIYTRKTIAYRLYPWQSRAIRDLIFEELDRAGVLDLGGYDPVQAVAAAILIPVEVVEVGLPPLLKDETFKLVNGNIVSPNFIEAQESSKSDKQRQKETRERRRAEALLSVTVSSQNVTDESQPVTVSSQNRTKSSQPVTTGHTASLSALLCSAELNYAMRDSDACAREGFSTSESEPDPEPESVTSSPAKPSSAATAVASAPTHGYSPSSEVPKGNLEALGADFNLTDLDRLISEARKCAKLGPYIARVTTYTKRSEAVDEIKAIAVERKVEPSEVARRALKNFFSAKDDWLVEHKYPLGSFCADVGRWFEPPEVKSEDEGGENYRHHMALRKASDEWIEKEREYDKQLAAEQREGGNGGNRKPITSIRGDPEKIKNVLDVVGMPPEIIKAQKELEEKRKVKGNV